MSVDKTPTGTNATPDQINDLSEKLLRFSETLDENSQVMASTLLSLSDDYRVRERIANSDTDEAHGMFSNAILLFLFKRKAKPDVTTLFCFKRHALAQRCDNNSKWITLGNDGVKSDAHST